jgi:ribulose-phosphate 3-epimerase
MSHTDLLASLNAAGPLINASLLASRFAHLEAEIRELEAAGAKILHIDVMDGHFVPNISFGVPIVGAVRRMTNLPLDVHLMITNPEEYIFPFREAGADILTIHIEVVPEPREILQRIRDLDALAGIALNPPTPVEPLLPYLDDCDLVLPMSVMPGFGGQSFQENVLDKLRWLRANGRDELLLEVDGGIAPDTIGACSAAGANVFVTGTSLLGAEDVSSQFALLRDRAQDALQDDPSSNA